MVARDLSSRGGARRVARHVRRPQRRKEVLGAVGLDHFDLDERRETSPWVTGMIVRRDHRGRGVGRTLMQHLERWAAEHSIAEAWVGTDLARGFYERCGWILQETFTSTAGQHMAVLRKRL